MPDNWAKVKRETTFDGTSYEITCPCGGTGFSYAQRGFTTPVPGSLPGDTKCEKCGQWYNGSGQPINDPKSWDPMDAGEYWDEDY